MSGWLAGWLFLFHIIAHMYFIFLFFLSLFITYLTNKTCIVSDRPKSAPNTYNLTTYSTTIHTHTTRYINYESFHRIEIHLIRPYIRPSHFLIDKFDYMDTFLHASPSMIWWNQYNIPVVVIAYGPVRSDLLWCSGLWPLYISMICHCVDKFVPLDYRFSNWNIDFPFIGHPLRAESELNFHWTCTHTHTQHIWKRSGNIWFGIYGVK